jgi:hypothetical protein
MTLEDDMRAGANAIDSALNGMLARDARGRCRVRRGRSADLSGSLGAGALAAAFAIAIAVGAPAAEAAAAAPHAAWGSLVATSAAPLPMRAAEYQTPDGEMDTLPRLGTVCITDESGHDVVVMGRMTDTTTYTRLFVTFSNDAPVTVRYGVSQDGTDYRTILDRDYRTEESREDDYVISLAVDAMKVHRDVCSR